MEAQEVSDTKKDIHWNEPIELLVKSIGEKALSLSWLHNRSEKRYSYLNNYLAIPSIILSTVVATVGSIFAGNDTASYASSFVSIIVSILSTLNSYFLFAKRAEAHRITAISYSKLYLQISIELSLPRNKRQSVKIFLKNVSEQVQRLNEIAPNVPDTVILLYNKKFSKLYPNVARPHITNGLEELKINVDAEPLTLFPKKEDTEIYSFEVNKPIQEEEKIDIPESKVKGKPPFK